MILKDIFNDKRVYFEIKSICINTGKDNIEMIMKLLSKKDKELIELKKYKELK